MLMTFHKGKKYKNPKIQQVFDEEFMLHDCRTRETKRTGRAEPGHRVLPQFPPDIVRTLFFYIHSMPNAKINK